VRRLRPEFWLQKNWLLHHENAPSHTSFFKMSFFTKNNLTVSPHPPYFSLFPRPKINLQGRHFDTSEAIEAESQAVLNTITEHDFQDAGQNGRNAGNGAYAKKGTILWLMVANRPRVSF
jgi:hypothetical protein